MYGLRAERSSSLEHQVLEEDARTRAARLFVLGPDVIHELRWRSVSSDPRQHHREPVRSVVIWYWNFGGRDAARRSWVAANNHRPASHGCSQQSRKPGHMIDYLLSRRSRWAPVLRLRDLADRRRHDFFVTGEYLHNRGPADQPHPRLDQPARLGGPLPPSSR